MTVSVRSLFTLLAGASVAAAAASWNTTCTTKSQRKAWHNMTDTEKSAYIEAELCLQSTAAKTSIEGAINRWDELDWAHIVQSNVIHNTGSFLPWHRYFMRVHEYLLQSECGYEGGQPYWNEVVDQGALANSSVFDPDTGFGGEGGEGDHERDALTFSSFQMLDVVGSPGDPLFFLHHTNLDRLWWEWQQANLTARLTDMGGRNVPYTSYLEQNGFDYPGAEILDYDGDSGNETTLNHNLWMVGLVPNATVAEVMDLGGDLICAEYV